MNGKKAKAIRRKALGNTIGLPHTCYLVETLVKKSFLNPLGKVEPELACESMPKPRTNAVLGKCTRKLYKVMKKLYLAEPSENRCMI